MIALAIIALVIFLILFSPVGVHIKYNDEFMLWLCYGVFRFKVLPAKEKKKKDKPKVNHKKKAKNSNQKFSFDDILLIIKTSLNAAESLIRTLRFKRFKLAAVISGEDAATAAINYGRACALASAAYPVFEKSFERKNTDISIDLEYDSKSRIDADIMIKAVTVKIVIIVIKILFALLPIINKKGGASNERSK